MDLTHLGSWMFVMSYGAALHNMPDQIGALASGHRADFAAFEGNPVADICALQSGATWVMQDGVVVVP